MGQLDYFHSKARNTNLSEDRAGYRCYRNRVSNAIKKAVYNRRLLHNTGNDHKTFWRPMKKILPCAGEKGCIPEHFYCRNFEF